MLCDGVGSGWVVQEGGDLCVFVVDSSFVWQKPQFSSSVVSNSLRPHEPRHARPPCPSPTPGVYPNPCPLSPWCHPTNQHNCKAIILQLKIHLKKEIENLNNFHNYLKILILSLICISDKRSFPKYLNKDYLQRRKGQITQKNGQTTWKDISQKKMAKKKFFFNSFDLTGTHRNANTQAEVQTLLPEWLKLKNTHNNRYRQRWEAREIHSLLVGIQIHITTVVKSGLNSSSWRYT